MSIPQVYEGTAQEIADQIRKSNLSGRLKAILTPENGLSLKAGSQNLATELDGFFAELDKIDFSPGKPLTDPHERQVSGLISRKLTAQGHTK